MNATATRANQSERRLISFAAAIVSLSSKLPRTPQGRHICGQILRSGTAAAANYGETRGAESRADFVHKLKVAFRELNETTIWLEGIAESPCFRQKRLSRRTENTGSSRPPAAFEISHQTSGSFGQLVSQRRSTNYK